MGSAEEYILNQNYSPDSMDLGFKKSIVKLEGGFGEFNKHSYIFLLCSRHTELITLNKKSTRGIKLCG